jgi:hypothetical protein
MSIDPSTSGVVGIAAYSVVVVSVGSPVVGAGGIDE